MPIYEYRCDSCGFQKEYIQRMSDAKLTDCPECKKATFSKMVTAAGFQLKGGGWYVTDFKSGGSNTNATNATGGPKKSVDKQSDTSGGAEPAKAESAKSESPKTEASASSSSTAPASTPAASTASTPASSSSS